MKWVHETQYFTTVNKLGVFHYTGKSPSNKFIFLSWSMFILVYGVGSIHKIHTQNMEH